MSLTVYLTLRSVLTAMGCKPPGQDAGQAGLVGERGWEEQCPPGVPGQQEMVTLWGLGHLLGSWGRVGSWGGMELYVDPHCQD